MRTTALETLNNLFTGDCSQEILSAIYDTVVPLLSSMISSKFKSAPTEVFGIVSHFAVAVGKDRFKHDYTKMVTSMGSTLFIVCDDLSRALYVSAIKRFCEIMGSDSGPLLKKAMLNINKKKEGHHFLAILIKSVHKDNFDFRASMIEEETKIAPYVKLLCMEGECVERAILTEEERNTLKRLLAHPDV